MTLLVAGTLLLACSSTPNRTTLSQRLRSPLADDSELLGAFEGRVPCASEFSDSGAPWPTPQPDGCQRVKIRLDLYRDLEGSPSRYVLHRIYVGQGDDVTTTEGKWTISRGTAADPDAIVYELDSNTPQEFRSFFVADDNILLFLDQDRRLMVGNPSESFTLSRRP